MKNPLWTRDEEKKFLKEIASGKTMVEIAKIHNRTPSGALLRLKKIIYETIKKGSSADKVSKTLKLPKDKINQYYQNYKDFLQKKQDTDNTNKTLSQKQSAPKKISDIKKSSNKSLKKSSNTSLKKSSNESLKNSSKKISKRLSSKAQSGGKNNTIDQIIKVDKNFGSVEKLQRLETENRILKNIIENNNLRNQLNGLIKENKLDSRILRILADQ
jgi:hypothetical protein